MSISLFLLKVTAVDPDEGLNGKLAYSIKGGNAGNAFTIDQTTGSIETLALIDRESVSEYNLQIAATDGIYTQFQLLINLI